MQYQVAVEARFDPETLERVPHVVCHCGSQVCSTSMEATGDARNVNIESTVTSPRSVDLLSNQLSRPVDAAYVTICQSITTSQQARA